MGDPEPIRHLRDLTSSVLLESHEVTLRNVMDAEGSEHHVNTFSGLRGIWLILLAACVLLVSTADALLLEIGQTFFTAGFNADEWTDTLK